MRYNSVLLGEISESIDYGVTASAEKNPVGPKFLRITDIQDGKVDWAGVPWCSCPERIAEKSRLRPGDIVFARTGATTGKSFLIRSCPDNSVFASYLIRVRLRMIADPGYISYFFQSQTYWSQIAGSSRGAAQPGVNATSLGALQIPLPPLEE
jgi:type I restriction enzyme S subunit